MSWLYFLPISIIASCPINIKFLDNHDSAYVAHQIEDKEEYKNVMKGRAATLYGPFEECCDHGKTEKGNIVFVLQ